MTNANIRFGNNDEQVKYNFHWTGCYRGAAHARCIITYLSNRFLAVRTHSVQKVWSSLKYQTTVLRWTTSSVIGSSIQSRIPTPVSWPAHVVIFKPLTRFQNIASSMGETHRKSPTKDHNLQTLHKYKLGIAVNKLKVCASNICTWMGSKCQPNWPSMTCIKISIAAHLWRTHIR